MPHSRRLFLSVSLALASTAMKAETLAVADASPVPNPGVVSGTYTLDGRTSDLRYAYARRRGDKIQVILTTMALDDAHIADLAEGHYRGMKKLAGVVITVDPAQGTHSDTQFIGEQGLDGRSGMTSSDGQGPSVANDRVIGNVALRNPSAAHQRAFMANFDAPLAAPAAAEQCSPTMLAQFQKLIGQWEVVRWNNVDEQGAPTLSFRGTLRVDERLRPAQLQGTMHIIAGQGGIELDERMSLDCRNDRIVVHGAVPPESLWSPDHFELELRNDRLVGGGTDLNGHGQQIELRRKR